MSKIRYRLVWNYANNEWQSWLEIATDVPSFYKNYNTLSGLAKGLGTGWMSSSIAYDETKTFNLADISRDGYGIFAISETNDYSTMIISNRYYQNGLKVVYDPTDRPVQSLFEITKAEGGSIITIKCISNFSNSGVFIKAL